MSRGVQDRACRVVHVPVRGARQQGLAARPLGGEDEFVQLDLPVGGGGADHEGPPDLAPVAAVVGAEADGQEVALLDPAVGRPVPGASGVRAGADGGREGRPVRPVVDEPALQLQREVAFGASDEDRFQQLAEGLVGDLRGDAQAGDLLLVLDEALLLHGEPQVGEAQFGRDGAQRPVPADGEVVLLHRERVRAYGGGHVRGGDGRVPGRGGQHRDPQPFVEAALVGLAGGRGGAEHDVLGGSDEQDGALRGRPGEVADVGRTRDQCGGVPRGGAAVAKQAPAGGVHV